VPGLTSVGFFFFFFFFLWYLEIHGSYRLAQDSLVFKPLEKTRKVKILRLFLSPAKFFRVGLLLVTQIIEMKLLK
jgi:hypothetical protein